MSMTPAKRITKARTQLLIRYPWFGVLALKLEVLEMDAAMAAYMPTMATDGTRLYYHPPFVDKLTDDELLGVVAHEVMHCALLHPYRRFNRDPLKWNIAVDHVVNLQLKECGLTLPAGCIEGAPQFKGLSAEQVYPQIKVVKQYINIGGVMDAPGSGSDGQKGDGKGKPQQGQGQDGAGDNTAQDWEIAVAQAEATARKAGNMPGHLSEALGKLREGQIDWRAYLQQFIQASVPTDYSWMRPNKRFAHAGMFLPGFKRENVGPVVVITDTSGSVFDAATQTAFASEINTILQTVKPEKVIVLYVDTEVQKVQEFLPTEGEFEFIVKGGGGTYFKPGFDWIAENMPEPPVCGIYLTDLENGDGVMKDPGFPFLWVVPDRITASGPFGETLRIPSEER